MPPPKFRGYGFTGKFIPQEFFLHVSGWRERGVEFKPEGYSGRAITAFGALGFMVPTYYSPLRKNRKEESPCNPIPPKILGVADSPPEFRGGVSEIPCFTVFFEGAPKNLGGEMPLKFRGGTGLQG